MQSGMLPCTLNVNPVMRLFIGYLVMTQKKKSKKMKSGSRSVSCMNIYYNARQECAWLSSLIMFIQCVQVVHFRFPPDLEGVDDGNPAEKVLFYKKCELDKKTELLTPEEIKMKVGIVSLIKATITT